MGVTINIESKVTKSIALPVNSNKDDKADKGYKTNDNDLIDVFVESDDCFRSFFSTFKK